MLFRSVAAGSVTARFAPERLFKIVFVMVAWSAAARLLLARETWKFGDDVPKGFLMRVYGFFVGLLSTLMGIGGGLFANLLMTFYGRPIHQAVATSSALAVLISIPGALGYVYAGWPAAARFPDVRVESDPIFVRDGTFWTSAGVTSGIDLALALVEDDLGRAAALAVARYLVVFLKRPGGQAQFSEILSLQTADDRFSALHDWISSHLADDLSLPTLANQAGMSERSFSRHYAEATGLTPARAIERLRVEGARHLLSETRLPIKRIAQRCGFGSEETMRRSFLRLLATTPQDYRARFAGQA